MTNESTPQQPKQGEPPLVKSIRSLRSLDDGWHRNEQILLEYIDRLSAENAALRTASTSLLDAMETCHICQGLIQIDDGPTHCEDCSWDCEEHEGDECPTLWTLHQKLRHALAPTQQTAQPVAKGEHA